MTYCFWHITDCTGEQVAGRLQQTLARCDLGSSDSSNKRKHVASGESPGSAAAREQQRVDAGGAKMADGPPVQQVWWHWADSHSRTLNVRISSPSELEIRLSGIISRLNSSSHQQLWKKPNDRNRQIILCCCDVKRNLLRESKKKTNPSSGLCPPQSLPVRFEPSQQPTSKPKKKKKVGLFRWAWAVGPP